MNMMDDSTGLGDHLLAETMSLALDHQLAPVEQEYFSRHLAACHLCQARWRRWQRIARLLELEPFAGPMPGFALRVDRRLLARQQRRERLLGGLVLVGGTVSLWGLLVLGFVVATAVLMFASPGARIGGLELLAFWGQLGALAIYSLYAMREAVLAILPGPMLLLVGVACLATMALIYWRVLPPRAVQPVGLNSGERPAGGDQVGLG